LLALFASPLQAQSEQREPETCPSSYEGRIVTREEVKAGSVPGSAQPLWILGWPCRAIYGGMEKGLVKFEKGKVREKIYDFQRKLAAAGFRPLFGGLGEGSGIGVGTIYDYPHRPEKAFHAMARLSFLSGYQQFSANYDSTPLPGATLNLVADYQWRPTEPYYGFGQDSSAEDESSFALRQSSLSFHWDQRILRRIQVGSIYSIAWLDGLSATGGPRPSVDEVFSDLDGLNERQSLQSIGAYVGLDGFQGDYRLGGRAQLGASWQESFSGPEVKYVRMEGRIEGRLPIVQGRSVLIGQVATDMLREASGTEPIPFYLYPRIGGSATLRGFPLDRFYGRNMILTTIEYRWLLHPRIEAELFHDSGQIFEHTHDLEFFDWHRNYGFGLRFRNATGTQFRFEFATSNEGISVHFTFGDRPLRAVGSGPVRYPLYRP
jgi:hypothetical protein